VGSVELLVRNWSDRQTEDFLRQKRQSLGSRAFARGYQQNALSDAEKLFPHFNDCVFPGSDAWSFINRDWLTVAGLDLAGKSRRGTCLVILAICPDSTRTRVPVAVEFGAWNSTEIALHVSDAIKTWQIRHTMIEDNSLQDAIIDLIELTSPGLELSGFTTGWNKRDPDIGLPSLDREFERRMWRIPDPHDSEECTCDYCIWLRQMQNYPAVDSADGVMAAWFAREAAVELGPGLGDLDDPYVGPDSRSKWEIEGAFSFGNRNRSFTWGISDLSQRRDQRWRSRK
jgi:hypothetical protein